MRTSGVSAMIPIHLFRNYASIIPDIFNNAALKLSDFNLLAFIALSPVDRAMKLDQIRLSVATDSVIDGYLIMNHRKVQPNIIIESNDYRVVFVVAKQSFDKMMISMRCTRRSIIEPESGFQRSSD